MSATYIPEPGDVVIFPGAYRPEMRAVRYVITATGRAAAMYRFEVDDRGQGPFTDPLAVLLELGMTKVGTVTKEAAE